MSKKLLPSDVSVRIVSWTKDSKILDTNICEQRTFAALSGTAKICLAMEGVNRHTLEVVCKEGLDPCPITAELLSTTPLKCRTVQPSVKYEDVTVSLERFWDFLCEAVEEVKATK